MCLKIITPFKFVKIYLSFSYYAISENMCYKFVIWSIKEKRFWENKYIAVIKNLAAQEVTMNIPNLITSLRFLLVPVFLYYFFSPIYYGLEISAAIFLLSGLTDTLDGYIARKYNQVTKLGMVLDPLADKLMLITVLVSVTLSNNIPIWIISIVTFKEILMIIGALSLLKENNIVVPANIFGKLSTLLAYIAIIAVLFELPLNRQILYAYVTATILALGIYLKGFLSIKKRQQFELIKK